MLQITPAGIRAHVRINGGWSVWEAQATGLDFDRNQLSIDKWYRISISCDKESIYIKIFTEAGEMFFDRKWEVPPGYVVSRFSSEEEDAEPINVPFPINLEYGSFGFRNSGNEEALTKNVLAQRI